MSSFLPLYGRPTPTNQNETTFVAAPSFQHLHDRATPGAQTHLGILNTSTSSTCIRDEHQPKANSALLFTPGLVDNASTSLHGIAEKDCLKHESDEIAIHQKNTK